MEVSRILIGQGLLLVLAGLLWPVLEKLGFGRMPGDILIQRDGLSLYMPLATSILVSQILSLVLWAINRWS
ncbi:hypothetical protein GGR34_001529 [Microvirga flocculans]|uniref:DUF2905 domain-containing protein n=1 Tax=Microvirga flocculans TaxID=217168 RepID=A0A7W6IE95_9HYPH|nr:DUF2905 domain-containing protein [Microvirga flocculans]MBB4039882.1 hypothetical protein [Microvirga flocculans]MDG2571270.1 DUF2905 domain-containing protein [Vibrio parahaemolyticus]